MVNIQVNCYHFYEMMTWLTVVTVIGFMKDLPDDYDNSCVICADEADRDANDNPYTSGFIYIAWISFVLDFILFFVLYKKEVILTGYGDGDDELEILFEVFADGQSYEPGVSNQPDGDGKGDDGNEDQREDRNDVELQVQQQIESHAVVTK